MAVDPSRGRSEEEAHTVPPAAPTQTGPVRETRTIEGFDLSATAPTKETAGRGSKSKEKKGPLSFAKELPVLLLLAFLLALLIKTFLIQAFYIPSGSMENTLRIGDRVLVNKVVYHFHPPRRGDIIVFEDPHAPPVHRNPFSAFAHWVTGGLGVAQSPDKDFIKRVIGVPGDTVEERNGKVFINGVQLQPEPYLYPGPNDRNWGPERVPQNELFVMGDHRVDSNDSTGGLGFIPVSKVVGRAFVIIWPPSHLRWLTTPSYSST